MRREEWARKVQREDEKGNLWVPSMRASRRAASDSVPTRSCCSRATRTAGPHGASLVVGAL